jgi:hypothetical protein
MRLFPIHKDRFVSARRSFAWKRVSLERESLAPVSLRMSAYRRRTIGLACMVAAVALTALTVSVGAGASGAPKATASFSAGQAKSSFQAGAPLQPAAGSNSASRGVLSIIVGGNEIAYTLLYSQLQGPATQAYLVEGDPLSGSRVVYLCGGGLAKHGPCPYGGSVTGRIRAVDISGGMANLIRAIRAGRIHVVVGTTHFESGEIEGRVLPTTRQAVARFLPGAYGIFQKHLKNIPAGVHSVPHWWGTQYYFSRGETYWVGYKSPNDAWGVIVAWLPGIYGKLAATAFWTIRAYARQVYSHGNCVQVVVKTTWPASAWPWYWNC